MVIVLSTNDSTIITSRLIKPNPFSQKKKYIYIYYLPNIISNYNNLILISY